MWVTMMSVALLNFKSPRHEIIRHSNIEQIMLSEVINYDYNL